MEDYKEILDYIRQVPVIDTHEHLVNSEDLLQGATMFFKSFLIHYELRPALFGARPGGSGRR